MLQMLRFFFNFYFAGYFPSKTPPNSPDLPPVPAAYIYVKINYNLASDLCAQSRLLCRFKNNFVPLLYIYNEQKRQIEL